MYVKIFTSFYKQTVKNITFTTSGFGGIYGLAMCNEKKDNKIYTLSKCIGTGAICGLAYPISISVYFYCIVNKCISNPISPSSDTPIL
jgi:hypothetical protein